MDSEVVNDKKNICNAFNDHFIKSSTLFDQLSGINETLETQANYSAVVSKKDGVLSPSQVPFLLRPINHFEVNNALCNSKCMKSSLGVD